MREGGKNARVFTCGENEENEREKKRKKLVGRLTSKTKNARVLRLGRREMKERKKIGWLFDEEKNARGSTCEEERNEREKKRQQSQCE